MLKNKLKKATLLGASALTIAAPIAAVISCSSDEVLQQVNTTQNNAANPAPNVADHSTAHQDGSFDPYLGQTVALEHGEIYAQKTNAAKDPNKWYAKPTTVRDWSQYNGEYAYWYAAENGWTPKAFQEWQKWVYNTRYQNITQKFGYSPWGLFYQTFNRIRWSEYEILNNVYHKDNDNPASSRWSNALKYMDNNIDNTIPWYAFRVDSSGDNFFSFDDHNVINGWRRLEEIGVLVPENIANVKAEAADNGTTRTHYLVNGEFVAKSALKENMHYYKVSETGKWGPNDKEYVRDDNGWICYVALSDNPDEVAGSGSHAKAVKNTTAEEQKAHKLEAEIKALFFYDATSQAQITAANRDYSHMPVINPTNSAYHASRFASYSGAGKSVAYPNGYSINPAYSKTDASADQAHINYTGADKNGAASSYYWQGKYTLVQAAPTWTDLLNDKLVVFPYEAIRGVGFMTGQTKDYSRWGRPNIYYSNYQSGEHGSWTEWAWVEDGKGGHKIYKSPDYDSLMTAIRGRVGDSSINVFYGNSNWLYPTKAVFKADMAGYKKFWYN